MSLIDDTNRSAEDPNPAELILQFMTVTGAEPLQLEGASSPKRITVDGEPVDLAIEAGADTVLTSWPTSVRGVTDHPRAWQIDGEVFFTIEPYLGNADGGFVARLFAAAGWRCASLPRGFGLWAPPRSRLFLIAEPDSKADLTVVRDRILQAKAPYHARSRHKDYSLSELVDEPGCASESL